MVEREVQTRVTIAAPPSVVWRVLVDVARYPEWSPSLRFGGTLREGNSVRLRLRLRGLPLATPARVDVFEPERELRWSGGTRLVMHGSHYLKLQPTPDGEGTELVHGEEFCGIAASLLWPLMEPELRRFYGCFNGALAARAEAVHERERVPEPSTRA